MNIRGLALAVFGFTFALLGLARWASAQELPLKGPGLGNLTYTASELFTPVSWIRRDDEGVPATYPGRKAFGLNVGIMHNGYFLTMFAPDSGLGPGGFLLYDVSNPRSIVLKKRIYEPEGRTKEFRESHAFGVSTVGGKNYIVVPSTVGIEFWDFTDINDIKQAKKFALPGVNSGDYSDVSWQIWWQAPYVYVAAANRGIYIVDATDPLNPVLANRGAGRPNPVPNSELGGFRVGPIFTMGNLMLLSSMDNRDGFSTLDISDPLNPRVLASVRNFDSIYYATCFDGKKMYTATRGAGGVIGGYDLSNPHQFVREAARLAIDEQLYCATQDNFLFEGAQTKVHKIDVSNPASYVEIGNGGLGVSNPDLGQVAPMGNLLFIGNDHGTGSAFMVHSTARDTTPPQVRNVSPGNAVQHQAVTSRVGVALSDSILPETVNAQTFIVRPVGGQPLAGTYSTQLGIINFSPAEKLLPGATYEVVLPANGIKDYAGNALAQEFKSTFTTRAVDNNIVHRWLLGRDLKDQIRGNDGTASGSDVYAEGGLDLANRTSGVQLKSDEVASTLGGTASVSLYVKTSQTTTATAMWQAPGIFGRDQTGGSNDVFWGWLDNQGFLNLSVGDPGTTNPGTKSAVRINDNVWHHVVMTRDSATGAQTMYVDGAKTSSTGLTGSLGLSVKFQMLGEIQGGGQVFRGILSDIRVYDRVLSDGDVAQIRAEKPVLHHWQLSQDLTDQIRGNDGTASGNDVFVDGGFSFANRTGGVSLARDEVADILGGTASLSLFMQTTQTTTQSQPWTTPGIFGRDQVNGDNDVFWGWLDNQGYINLSVGNAAVGNPGTKSTVRVNDGAWHHVAMTRDAVSGAQVVYVDGVKTTSTGRTGTLGLNNKFQLLGQIQGNSDFFKGTLADVRVYDRILSDADVAVLRAQRPTVFPPSQTGNSVQFDPAQLGLSGASYVWNFGDGTTLTTTSSDPIANHTYTTPGHYTVTVRVIQSNGEETTYSYMVPITRPLTASAPTHSTNITSDGTSVYSLNPDSGTVTAIDAQTLAKRWEVAVGAEPMTLAKAPDGTIWVAVYGEDKLVALRSNGTVAQTVPLAYGSGPHGIVFTPDGSKGLVTLESKSLLSVFNPSTGEITQTLNLPAGSPRGIAVSGDSSTAYITRFKSLMTGGELYKVNLSTMAAPTTINLRVDTTTVDNENAARGVPNFMHQVVISPDGTRAVLPSKKDNIAAGLFRDGTQLRHDTTVRSILSQIDLAGDTELVNQQIDFDDRAPARAAVFSPWGDYIFVAQMEGNRVEFVDAYNGTVRGDISAAGITPHGLYLDAARKRLFVNNFLARSVSVHDVGAILASQASQSSLVGTVQTVATEPFTQTVLAGKKVFYNAADGRMSSDGYISCASCHVDGGDDGIVWDFTQRGEGLRRTISLQGRQGMGHGNVHWTANFNEIQDFEHDIRKEFGGLGFTPDAVYQARPNPLTSEPLAGHSADLDNLAAFVTSLDKFPRSPARTSSGCLTAEAQAGQITYNNAGCASCHSGATLRDGARHDVGTIQASSGTGSGQSLAGVGFDTPTLYGVWDTAPYFHNGQAQTLNEVFTVGVHANGVPANQVNGLVAYLRSLDQRNQCTTQ